MGDGARSVAEAYLALLKERGIDHLYVGAGTDTAPLVEAYARAAQSGLQFPQPVVAAHENLAVGMAHGYTMVTGRPQAVMLHVSVGAANAACAVINAARAQVPMLFTAGRTPLFEQGPPGARDSEIQWAQEMFDQAGMLREFVKWDYELRDGAQLGAVVDRALAVAAAEPRGPVYLTLPREVLVRPAPAAEPAAMAAPAAAPAPDPQALARLAAALAAAQRPVILCTASGADPTTVPALVALAERFGIAVGEARSRHMCFPDRHPLHLGHDAAAIHAGADALLFLESDVPWVPSKSAPAAGAFVAHAGVDPLFLRYPIRSHRADLTITSSVRNLLPALVAALDACGAAQDAPARRARMADWARTLQARAQYRTERDRAAGGPITKTYLSHCLAAVVPSDAIVVNEYSAVRECFSFDRPGGYFVHPTSAGLGWGLPAALGAQQAAPGRCVIVMLGDGAYLFANPAVCHQAAAMHGLPVVTIVFDNGGWQAVQNAATGLYPQGAAAAARGRAMAPLASLEPLPDFARYAEASGGVGLRVGARDELAAVLAQAIEVAGTQRRQVLVHVTGQG